MTTMGLIAAVAAVAGLVNFPAFAQMPIPVDEIARAHQAEKAALDPTLPKRIDGMTVLPGVRINDVTLTYQYRIELDKADVKPEFEAALGRKSIAIACGDARRWKILQAGGRYGFEYVDRFDELILQVTVGKDDCI